MLKRDDGSPACERAVACDGDTSTRPRTEVARTHHLIADAVEVGGGGPEPTRLARCDRMSLRSLVFLRLAMSLGRYTLGAVEGRQ